MSREILPSSDAIKYSTTKYPWNTLTVGYSFRVAYDEAKLRTLQNYASRTGKKLGKRFRVIDHGEAIGYEIGRIL